MKLSIFKKFLIVFGFSLIIVAFTNSGVYATETCQKPCYANKCYIVLGFNDLQCRLDAVIGFCFDEKGDLTDEFNDPDYCYTIQKGAKCYSLIAIRKDNVVDGDSVRKFELKLRFSDSCGEDSCIKIKCGSFRGYNDDCKLIFCYSLTGYKFDLDDTKTQLVPQIEQGFSSLLEK